MGDRSPKSNQKLASQKQVKTDHQSEKKRREIADKQAPAKVAGAKKK